MAKPECAWPVYPENRGHRGWSGMTKVENESRIQKIEGVKGRGINHCKDLDFGFYYV